MGMDVLPRRRNSRGLEGGACLSHARPARTSPQTPTRKRCPRSRKSHLTPAGFLQRPPRIGLRFSEASPSPELLPAPSRAVGGRKPRPFVPHKTPGRPETACRPSGEGLAWLPRLPARMDGEGLGGPEPLARAAQGGPPLRSVGGDPQLVGAGLVAGEGREGPPHKGRRQPQRCRVGAASPAASCGQNDRNGRSFFHGC